MSRSSDPEAAFAAVAAPLLAEPDVDEGTGFGANPGLRSNGKIFAMLVRGDLVVKLPAERCEELIDGGTATAFAVGRRAMREWIAVEKVDAKTWQALASEARAFARS